MNYSYTTLIETFHRTCWLSLTTPLGPIESIECTYVLPAVDKKNPIVVRRNTSAGICILKEMLTTEIKHFHRYLDLSLEYNSFTEWWESNCSINY